ncbi:ParB/RepB/Spo0J family partition protein [Granulicella cerasi]|uniref:ParB/RepB/Spo0J family partition protein n=1 Tax=Granulicella cerasi TaxID=741063 RepID=A0ABW1ZEY5_9BACT|nr:plasmid partitioning protein RepB C-terminal domain-containing protein [Granulicella cerasi]
MNMESAEDIPVDRILVVNPRTRNRVKWLEIVASIKAVGLKRPITVCPRKEPDDAGHTYDLVCGQGRLEAHIELGQPTIKAVLIEASEADRYLMSLVENIARRPSSYKAIYFEVRNLLERGYDGSTIAQKLGIDRSYVHGLVRLVERGEAKLIEQVELGRIPISVAVQIASGDDDELQKALAEGYESGELRGSKLQAVRKLIKDRRAHREGKVKPTKKPLTGAALANLYKVRVREQQRLVAKADQAREKLLIVATVMRTLLADEDLITMLRAENLFDMPEQLALRVR